MAQAILAQVGSGHCFDFFGRFHAMSAAVIGQLLSACAGAYSAASSAVWWAAFWPPTCRESLTHAAFTCSGATPRYFTPGFGPLALASGWLLLGVLLGLLFRREGFGSIRVRFVAAQCGQATAGWQ